MKSSRIGLALAGSLALGGSVAWAQDGEVEQRVLASVRRIQAEVSAMRGLEYQAPVRAGIHGRSDLQAMILGELDTEAPAEELVRQEQVLKAFGLIPQDYDLRAKMIEFLVENIGGYYDPEAKELFLIDQSDNPQMGAGPQAEMMQEMVMAHELHHALQDQNFDLSRWFDVIGDHEDRIQGYKSLVEGEAQLVGYNYLFGKMGRGEADMAQLNRMQEMMMRMSPEAAKLREAPPYLVENMMFPYTQGSEFVQLMQREHGWERVTAAFSDPPVSTEQVLHPEKYLGQRDDPVELELRDLTSALGETAEEYYSNTQGEFNVSLLLRALGVDKPQAERAAAGWDGDRFEGYGVDGRVVVVWLTTWDSEAEAQEFERIYGQALARQRPDSHLERRGADVLWVYGSDGDELEQLIRRGFQAVKISMSFAPTQDFLAQPPRSDFEAAPEAPQPRFYRLEGASFEVPEGLRAEHREAGHLLLGGPLSVGAAWVDGDFEAAEALAYETITETLGDIPAVKTSEAVWAEELLARRASYGTQAQVWSVEVDDATFCLWVVGDEAGQVLEGVLGSLWIDLPSEGTPFVGALEGGAQVTFPVPTGFTVSALESGRGWALAGPDGAVIKVTHRSDDGTELAAAAAVMARQLPMVLEAFELRSMGVAERQGNDLLDVDYVSAAGRTHLRSWRAGSERWTVTCTAPEAQFGTHLQAFGQVTGNVSVD